MIQRIQSVFLLVVVIAMSLAVLFPSWQKQNSETGEKVVLSAWNLTHTKGETVVNTSTTIVIAALSIASAILALYSIFMFRNRINQIKVVLFNNLLMCGTLVAMFLYVTSGEETFAQPKYGIYGLGFYLPMVAIVCNWLARRYIKKDEDLVRSSDRLR